MSGDSREKILIALEMAEASSRDRLAGLFRHIGRMRHWEIRLVQSAAEFTPRRLEAELADGITGLVTCTAGVEGLTEALIRAPIPFVTVDVHATAWKRRKRNVTHLCVDDARIGEAGARHLADTNPTSFGYVPWPKICGWSEIRERTFKRELARRGFPCSVFAESSTDRQRDRKALEVWLDTLPKPAAIMCASDERAMQVLEVCNNPERSVPNRVAVLGVDDDECYCDYSKPPLSSIAIDYIHEGYRAAVELERLLTIRHPPRAQRIVLPFRDFVERLSTKPFNPAEMLVKRAQKYIAEQALRGVTATDVALHLGVSRRLLDLRHVAYTGKTVSQALEDVRLEEVRRLLTKTDRPLKDIASRCGFANLGSLRNLFRLRTGMSMRKFRAQKATP